MEKIASRQAGVKRELHPAVRLLLAKHRELTELRQWVQLEIEDITERIRLVDEAVRTGHI